MIGVSANADCESENDAIAAGMNHFIPKPLSLQVSKEYLLRHNTSLISMEP